MVPDFFVIGAQKAGTTTLCSVLAEHPEVRFSRPKEPMFFCRDDLRVHPYFPVEHPSGWWQFDCRGERDQLLEAYGRYFDGVDGSVVGEGSTTYLPSARAASRIAGVSPDARLVVLLRNPVDRAYSAYWHMVRTARTRHRFELALKLDPLNLLEFGRYQLHIRRYLEHFDRDQMLFLSFRDLVESLQATVDRVCAFLDLGESIDVGSVERDENRGRAPLLPVLQRAVNGLVCRSGLPIAPPELRQGAPSSGLGVTLGRVAREVGKLNPRIRPYPAMKPKVRRWLTRFYRRENRDLEAMTGVATSHWWKAETEG